MQLNKKEIQILENTDFLLTKATVLTKIYKLLELTRKELNEVITKTNFSFPEGTDLVTGKISRGENYRNLPYMVLDHPTLFNVKSIFAYRTMFWWGNFFSFTLHLEGEALSVCRKILSNNIDKLLNQDIYIGIGETPWQYHYEKSNYLLLDKNHKGSIMNSNFIKLSKKIEIKDWKKVPGFSKLFFEFLLSILKM